MANAEPASAEALFLLSRYHPLSGVRATDRLVKKARRLKGVKVLHVNSSRQGGGVAELLSSLTPLMNDLGIETGWQVIDGSPDFFSFTKGIHNGLHGQAIAPAPEGMALHRHIVHANGAGASLEAYDVV